MPDLMGSSDESVKVRSSVEKAAGENESIFNEREMRRVGNEHVVTLNDPYSPIAEEYRRLKSILLRDTHEDSLKTIMITSALESEGKTLTAVNLAVTLAQEVNHSAILIDGDLRKPMVHEYLEISPGYGLTEYLTRKVDWEETVVETGLGNLLVIPAGTVAKNPAELVSSGKMKELLNILKSQYPDRYIIIDSPPILHVADSISLGSIVDGVILVVREGYAQRNAIEDALNMVKDINVLGIVYNKVTITNLDSHYSRYYRYGYGHEGRKR